MDSNLIFYAYIADIDNIDIATQLNINALRRYSDIFNGEKIIYISVDHYCDILDYVLISAQFTFLGEYCFYIVSNDSDSRESMYFIDAIKDIKNMDSITFYSHNKGCTRSLDATTRHRICMPYYFNLEYMDNVINKIVYGKYITYGILKVETPDLIDVRNPKNPWNGWVPQQFYDWHYSGCFCWFNTKKLVSMVGWDNIKYCYEGIEEYWGHKFPSELAYNDDRLMISNRENNDSDTRKYLKQNLSVTEYNSYIKYYESVL